VIPWIEQLFKSGQYLRAGTSEPAWKGNSRWQGRTKRIGGKGFGRKVRPHHPLNMNREVFDTQALRDDRFRELKAKKTPDLCRGMLGNKYYVAFR
jgi:hypothetical protein